MPNNNRDLVPAGNTNQPPALPIANNPISFYPPGFVFPTDAANASLTYQPMTNMYTFSLPPNTKRTKCPMCNEAFYDRAKMKEHEDDNTARCRICNKQTVWCVVGLVNSSYLACGEISCAMDAKCFPTRKEAIDHAMESPHTKCFFPDCKHTLAQGGGDEGEVRRHIWSRHWEQYSD